jgi:DNA mismatch endonuclease (patch repair protein)
MVDVHTPEQRRLNMSRVRSSNTKPELLVRKGLHARGLRFRLHRRDLPGRPDIVFASRRAAVFVHGCFWHGHDCPLFKVPSTRTDFWVRKISANSKRDAAVLASLKSLSWRTIVIWECALRGPIKLSFDHLLDRTQNFIEGNARADVVSGELRERRVAPQLLVDAGGSPPTAERARVAG